LDAVARFDATALVGGRGAVTSDAPAAIAQSRHFLDELRRTVRTAHAAGGTAADAFAAAHAALADDFGAWPIFEHCLPFNVQRHWDELDGPVVAA
jgi:hypothetical protein